MRPIEELLAFLENQMSMQAVYQPVVILHLLSRDGYATRADLARTLSGYDEMGLEFWDRILMDSPKRALVSKHQILHYDKESQVFRLNFDLTNTSELEKARNICEKAILAWIQRASADGRLDEAGVLQHYRTLELAKRGEQYSISDEDVVNELAVEEFALQVAVGHIYTQYPNQKISQQPFNTPGFDILVGTVEYPLAYVKVKATQKPTAAFTLSEGDRQFSIEHSNCYLLAMVYNINLNNEKYKMAFHKGAIKTDQFLMTPQLWRIKLLQRS